MLGLLLVGWLVGVQLNLIIICFLCRMVNKRISTEVHFERSILNIRARMVYSNSMRQSNVKTRESHYLQFLTEFRLQRQIMPRVIGALRTSLSHPFSVCVLFSFLSYLFGDLIIISNTSTKLVVFDSSFLLISLLLTK